MRLFHIPLILTFSLILSACGSNSVIMVNQAKTQPTLALPTQTTVPPTEKSEAQPAQAVGPSIQLDELTDNQGAVTVTVKPSDFSSQDAKLDFEVSLNTHSVDLNMDLAAQSTLTTDTGLQVQASLWDAPRGGHHVSGTLSFPSRVDGKAILDGTSKLTLTIKNIDAPERTFVWNLK